MIIKAQVGAPPYFRGESRCKLVDTLSDRAPSGGNQLLKHEAPRKSRKVPQMNRAFALNQVIYPLGRAPLLLYASHQGFFQKEQIAQRHDLSFDDKANTLGPPNLHEKGEGAPRVR